jgi:hypothetical protein
VDDAETLGALGREDLRKILTALGRAVSGNLAKAEFISKIVELAEATEFAPIVPPAPEKAPKAPKGAAGGPKAEGVCGKLWAMYDAALAGGDLNRKTCLEQAAAAGINPATAKTQWQRWRTARGLV